MDDDEYAIVSKKEFMALKAEIEKLKRNPLEGSEHGENLQASIDNLNKGLNNMLEVFKQASDDMKLEEHDSEVLAKQISPLNDKLETLIDQNQKIAKGIVAVADMIREKLDEKPKIRPLGAPRPSGSGMSSPSSGMPPGMPPGMPSQPQGMPPPNIPPPGMLPRRPSSPPGFDDDFGFPSGSPSSMPPGMPPPGSAPQGFPPLDSPGSKDLMRGLMK